MRFRTVVFVLLALLVAAVAFVVGLEDGDPVSRLLAAQAREDAETAAALRPTPSEEQTRARRAAIAALRSQGLPSTPGALTAALEWTEGVAMVVRATRDGVEPLDGLGDLRYVLDWAIRRGYRRIEEGERVPWSRDHCRVDVLATGETSEADWAHLRRLAQEEGYGTLCVYEQQPDGHVERRPERLAPEGGCALRGNICFLDDLRLVREGHTRPHRVRPSLFPPRR